MAICDQGYLEMSSLRGYCPTLEATVHLHSNLYKSCIIEEGLQTRRLLTAMLAVNFTDEKTWFLMRQGRTYTHFPYLTARAIENGTTTQS